ncbi:MAG: hypothetical protein KY469_10755 [Actinobacteria bacterium]|nr:hypothetical protein [Actinomycetota bacterium]
MSAKKLKTDVHVANEAGETQVFKAGTTPPPEVANRITNPNAWEEGDTSAQDATDDAGGEAPALPDDAPPRAGKGSGTEEWRAYATEKFGLELAEDASRDDIIEAVSAAHTANG